MHLLSPLLDSELCDTAADTREMLTEHLLKEKGKEMSNSFLITVSKPPQWKSPEDYRETTGKAVWEPPGLLMMLQEPKWRV